MTQLNVACSTDSCPTYNFFCRCLSICDCVCASSRLINEVSYSCIVHRIAIDVALIAKAFAIYIYIYVCCGKDGQEGLMPLLSRMPLLWGGYS